MFKPIAAGLAIVAVLISPCAWDTDPKEMIGVANIIAHMARSSQAQQPSMAPTATTTAHLTP